MCPELIWMVEIWPAFIWNLYKTSPAMVGEMCENWHSGWTWANKRLGNWIRTNLYSVPNLDEWIYSQRSSGISTRPRRYGRRDTCVKTDILVEPELTKNWKLNKDEFTVYQTWMSGYTANVHLESLQGLARYGREMCENWHSGWTWANKTLGNWIRTNLQCTKLGRVGIRPVFIWNLYKASP